MKQLQKLKAFLGGSTLAVLVLAGVSASALPAAPTASRSNLKPPHTNNVSGPQSKPAVEAGKVDATKEAAKGSTNYVAANADGSKVATKQTMAAAAGYNSAVDFSTPYNYCYHNLTYTTLKNNTSSTQYVQVRLYNQTGYRDIYTSVAANSYAYPAFYGVDGAWYAYAYVWNGTSYSYDEYMSGNNTCQVSVSRTYNYGGWVQLKIQNTGTAYATQVSSELAPYPLNSTYSPYTGTLYDYPTAGGAAVYRWFYVGYSPYGISSVTSGSWNYPSYFTGDL